MLIGVILVLIEQTTFVFDFVTLATALMFGVMVGGCRIATFYSLQVTSVAISNMSATASVIIPCFVGMVFFHEAITAGKIIGIIAFLIAAYLIIAQKNKEKQPFTIKSLLACLIVFFTNGFGAIAMQLFAKYANGVSDSLFLFYSYSFETVILLAFIFISSLNNKPQKNEEPVVFSKDLFWLGAISAAFIFFLHQTNVVLANEIPAVVLFPVLKSGSLILGAIVGWMIFKEKLSVKNIIGIIIAIGALILLNF